MAASPRVDSSLDMIVEPFTEMDEPKQDAPDSEAELPSESLAADREDPITACPVIEMVLPWLDGPAILRLDDITAAPDIRT